MGGQESRGQALRETVALTVALRKLEGLKSRADAEPTPTGRLPLPVRRGTARREPQQKGRDESADLEPSQTARAELQTEVDAAAMAKDAAKVSRDAEGQHSQGSEPREAGGAGIDLHQWCDAKLCVRRHT